jgi:RNA polymerase sigma factor (sigma-70 family)
MPERGEQELLDRIAGGGPESWNAFLESCADQIFRVIRLFADGYDERMDLFLFVCDRLKEDRMRRLRAFAFRPEAPCRFSTYLSVIVKNMAVDFIRAREGRFRPFRVVESMDETDRLLFEYHLKDGRPLEEARDLIGSRHGIRLSAAQASERAGRLQSGLSASQRWRLLSRIFERRRPVPLDSVAGALLGEEEGTPRAGEGADPERPLRSMEADRALRTAMEGVPPRQRLALTLRFRDGLPAKDAAALLGVTPAEADRLARSGVERIRERLMQSGVARADLDASGLAAIWTG